MAKKTVKHFLKRAIAKHGDRYGYKLVSYKNADTKVLITCYEHGEFSQAPKHHYIGRGCPTCGARWSARRFNSVPTMLYYVKVGHGDTVGWKVGITTSSVKIRYKKDIKAGTTVEVLDEVWYTGGREAFNMEQDILRAFKGSIHPDGIGLLFDGGTEVLVADMLGGSLPQL